MIVLGIDPGLDGALCIMSGDESIDTIIDMPTLEVMRGGRPRREPDGHSVNAQLTRWFISHAFMEQAWPRPNEGAIHSFKFGEGYGLLRGILIARGTPITMVSPQAWKRDLSLGKGKDAARARASELLGHASYLWPLKKHDGRAESALIALWGVRALNAIASGKAA